MTQYSEGQEVEAQLFKNGEWWKAKVLWPWGDDHPLDPGRYEVVGSFGQHTLDEERIRAIEPKKAA